MQRAHIDFLLEKTGLPSKSVHAVIKLLDEGSTVPFIARYRKEMTGSLDEVAILQIQEAYQQLNDLIKRKATILKTIEEQKALTPKLRKEIEVCMDKQKLEDLYLPFKKKVKTRATVAIELGLEPLAKTIMSQQVHNLSNETKRFINKKVKNSEAALAGARDIIAGWVNENIKARELVRGSFSRFALIESKVVKSKKEDAIKFKQYFEYSEPLKKCPSHRILAMYRGESLGYLRVKLSIDDSYATKGIKRGLIKNLRSECGQQIALAISDALKRLIIPAVENEFKKAAKLKADKAAIDVFSKNLKELLLAPPLGEKKTLAIDPGYKSGCKVVVLNPQGGLIHYENIFPHPPQKRTDEAIERLMHLIETHKVEAIAVGNGTAGKETLALVKNIKSNHPLESYMINESGASIYSASKLAREEFPNHDVTVRGAVSIGRRLMDPLAELVKIDAKSIGVGQYQHDVDQKLLKESLDTCVISAVNSVGINLNTASATLLEKISGVGPTLAQNIVNYRKQNGEFVSRIALKKVPRMGPKAYEQCVGFLRIKSGKVPLDDTGIHPESYSVVKEMCKATNSAVDKLINNLDLINQIDPQQFVQAEKGLPTILDIIEELKKPGLDPRGKAEAFQFSANINKISDLQIGMRLPGIINNVTKFGAFVDIGVKESGLVHISQIRDAYVSDPSDILAVNQRVQVKVIGIDIGQGRITLSMKE